MPKILIIRFSSIGDIVLTSPAIRNIKNQIKDCELHFCTKFAFKETVKNNPYLDKVFYLKQDFSSLVQKLKAENYDIVIDLHKNLRTQLLRLQLGKKWYTFDKLNIQKWLLVNFKINKLPDVHIVDRYLEPLKSLGVTNDQQGLDYFISPADEIEMWQFPEKFRHGYIAFVIGAQHNTKKLPQEKIIEFCETIGEPIILIGGEDDRETGRHIEAHFRNSNTPIYNACGKYTINQSASIVKNSKLVFSHDTGFMHIAAAYKKEIYSIWGNTIPGFGMYPYKTKFHVVENKNLSCRPCSKLGYIKCPQGHFQCMRSLHLDPDFNYIESSSDAV